MSVWDVCVVNDSHRRQPTIQASYHSYERAIARPSYALAINLAICRASRLATERGQRLKPSQVLPSWRLSTANHIGSWSDNMLSLQLHWTINTFETFTLYSRVTLIRKPQSTPDLDHLQARPVLYSRVKSRDDLISGRRGDSGVQFSKYFFLNVQLVCSNNNILSING